MQFSNRCIVRPNSRRPRDPQRGATDRLRRALALAAFLCTLPALAVAQKWQVINLHPAGATGSAAIAASGNVQVGVVEVGGVSHAAKWTGRARSFVDLHPVQAGATSSVAHDVDATNVVGRIYTGAGSGTARAGWWSGGSGTWTDLHPPGAFVSQANGVFGTMQVGLVVSSNGAGSRAAAWFGTAASRIDLHPNLAGATQSRAMAADGVLIAGQAVVNGLPRAILWDLSAGLWVDLTPAGAELAYLDDVHNGEQVGTAKVGGYWHASLWRNTVWIDLHPAGAQYSQAYGVHLGQQVGYIRASGSNELHASFWDGTAASCVDLNEFLPKRLKGGSIAWGISHDANYIYVVGHASDPKASGSEAILWRRRR